jgi:hypothetical protein
LNIINMTTLPFNIANNWNVILQQIQNYSGQNLIIDASDNNYSILFTNKGNVKLDVSSNITTFFTGITINNPSTTSTTLNLTNSTGVSSTYSQLQLKNSFDVKSSQLNIYSSDSSTGYNLYNGIAQQYDTGIFYTTNGSTTTSNAGFSICPYLGSSTSSGGLRMDASGNVNITGTLTATSYGGLIAPLYTTYTSGSGSYSVPTSPSPLYLYIKMIGGGGGGGGAAPVGTATAFGGVGGTTTFGTSLFTCTGGGGGTGTSTLGGSGGSFTLTPSSSIIPVTTSNGVGGSGQVVNGPLSYQVGGAGANSQFGGGGGGGEAGETAFGYGSGGGGGGTVYVGSNYSGGGGGSGGYIEAIIIPPFSASYSYQVGGPGSYGAAQASYGGPGGYGASGVIIIGAYYQ